MGYEQMIITIADNGISSKNSFHSTQQFKEHRGLGGPLYLPTRGGCAAGGAGGRGRPGGLCQRAALGAEHLPLGGEARERGGEPADHQDLDRRIFRA